MIGTTGIILLIVVIILLPLIALIDILSHEFTGTNKLIWVIIVLFFPIMGAILYFLIGTRQKIR
jgi:hypothetical protein